MPLIDVNDLDDPALVPYRGVADPVWLREQGLFIAEGRLVVRRLLLESPFTPVSVLVTANGLAALAGVLEDRAPDLPVYVAPQAVMNAAAGFNLHRGCLAAGVRPAPRPLATLLESPPRRLLVLESVSNPDNVGGIFRCAAALGAAGVVLGPGSGDPLYRKAIRTSIGTTLTLPFATAGAWPGAIIQLRERGLVVIALTPEPDARDLVEVAREREPSAHLALLLGAEGQGLSAEACAAADLRARIPITGSVDSLNVTVAAGIALHALR